MTDIIAQAEAWCNATVTAPLETEPELCIDGARMLPQLLAEAKRLSEISLNAISVSSKALRKAHKQAIRAGNFRKDRDAWKVKAIEERAILKGGYLNDIITEIHDDWIDVKESTKMAFRKQAACELEEEMKQDE